MIVWKEEYSVGNPELDKQHQALIKLINRLSNEERTGGMTSFVFDELDLYVKEHFRTEENYMTSAGYSGLYEHKAEHSVFEEWLQAVRQSFSLGGLSGQYLVHMVSDFLQDWLISHILKSDQAYAKELADRQ